MKKNILTVILATVALDAQSQNLTGYYPFSGNADDMSNTANHGTVYGAALAEDRFGNPNSAYYFDGINDYIECVMPGPVGTSPRTISFWAKTSTIPGSSLDNVVLAYGVHTGSYDYGGRFEIHVNAKAYGVGIDVAGAYLTKSFDNSDGGWHFYTVVFEGGTGKKMDDLKFYADGVLRTTNVVRVDHGHNINTKDEYNLNIGRLYNNSRFFSGSIDEIRIYDAALSDEEILLSYQQGLGLVAYYPFSGNADDASGKEHHGTVHGPVPTVDRYGNTNSAYLFDGIDDYMDLGDWENGGPMSFTFWARWDALNDWSRILDLGNETNGSSTPNDNIVISNRYSQNEFAFAVFDGSSKSNLYIGNTINVGMWDHYGVTIDSDRSMEVYKNGTPIGQYADGHVPRVLERTAQYLGKSYYDGNGYFKGAMDDIRIYNGVLSAEDIQNDYLQQPTVLVAYYPFNGNTEDESGHGNHGTAAGATPTEDRFGNSSSAYAFDGNDYITVPHDKSLNMSGALSFSFWIKPASTSGTQMVLGKSNYTSATNYLVRLKEGGVVQWEYQNYTENTTPVLSTDAWHHVVVTSSGPGTDKKIYIDNELATTTNPSGGTYGLVNNLLTIGYAGYGSEYFNGAIDDIRMYKGELSAPEVHKLYYETHAHVSITACESYSAPSGMCTWTESGMYKDIIANQAGGDSLITIDLTILHGSSTAIEVTACDSYSSPSGKYLWTESNVYQDTIANRADCDSVITIDLTIHPTYEVEVDRSICAGEIFVFDGQDLTESGTYTATLPSITQCDSVVTLHLTFNPVYDVERQKSICRGDAFSFNGTEYTESGTYTAHLSTIAGCDSTVTLQLTVVDINASVIAEGNTLTAAEEGAQYQWVNCENLSALDGATGRSFTAVSTGNYAVRITRNGCLSVSECTDIAITGIIENLLSQDLSVFPNPTSGKVIVEFGREYKSMTIYVSDIAGQIVDKFECTATEQVTVPIEGKTGLYLLRLETEEGKHAVVRVLKK